MAAVERVNGCIVPVQHTWYQLRNRHAKEAFLVRTEATATTTTTAAATTMTTTTAATTPSIPITTTATTAPSSTHSKPDTTPSYKRAMLEQKQQQ